MDWYCQDPFGHYEMRDGYERPRRGDRRADYATANRGARYPINDEDLEILQNPRYGANLQPFPYPVPMLDAAEQLFAPHRIKQTAEYRAAWNRILATSEQKLTMSLLVKMFNDLDTILFHGDLHFRVCFKWVDMTVYGLPGEIGFTEAPDDFNRNRISLCMSRDADWKMYPLDYALGVLLHEMLHAYFMVWCRNDTLESEWEEGQHPEHGRIYMACARRIGQKMAADLTSNPEEVWSGMEQGDHDRCAYPTMGRPMMGDPMMGNTMMWDPMWGDPIMGNPMMGNPTMQPPPMHTFGNPFGMPMHPWGMMPPWGMW